MKRSRPNKEESSSDQEETQERPKNKKIKLLSPSQVVNRTNKKKQDTPSCTTPRVVRLRRSKDLVIQDCDVYIGRKCTMGGWNLKQSKWHNPFSVKDSGSVEAAVEKFREYIVKQPELMSALHELEGKTLGCWCKNKPTDACHGDVLVELVQKYVDSKKLEAHNETDCVKDRDQKRQPGTVSKYFVHLKTPDNIESH